MRSFLLRTSSAIAVALLAFSFAMGGTNAVRADDSELSLPVQVSVLMPIKDVDALKQRVEYLEETVATLKESWQHFNTNRLCVSDGSGAETCLTKAQLDAVLISQAHAEGSSPAVDVVATVRPPSEEPITIATDKSEPETTPVSETSQEEQQPAQTGALIPSTPAVELNMIPDAETSDLP